MTVNDKDGWRLEQHIGTLLQILVAGLLTWSLKTNVDTRYEIGVLQTQVASLQSVVNQGTTDRYRGSDAARDMAAIWAEFSRQAARIDRCEGKR